MSNGTASSQITAFPVDREAHAAPPNIYATWREAESLPRVHLASGRESLVVTRYADVKEMLSRHDSVALTANRFAPGFPGLPKGITGVSPDANLLFMDEPQHGAVRRMLFSSFTAKAVNAMRPGIQECVDGVVDTLIAAGPPADLHAMFSLPVPSLMICQLLGVPYSDHELFQQMTEHILTRNVAQDVFEESVHRMHDYMERIVTAKELDPGDDDMLGRLIRQQGQISHNQLVGLAMFMLIAGHETTSNSLSMGMVHLLTDHAVRAAVQDDPGLTLAFVDETVRLDSIADFVAARLTRSDITIGKCPVSAGEGLIAAVGAANHDPEVFPNPDQIDLRRGTKQHLGFGFGLHSCIGQHLARAQLEISYATLLRRLPDLKLAVDPDDLEFRRDGMVYGVRRLPVTW